MGELMVYASMLRTKYGLTRRLIKRLGEPDESVPNPHWKSGPPAGLYAVARVEQFIAAHSTEVEAAARKREARRMAARKGVKTKKARLQADLESEPLRLLKALPGTYLELVERANAHAASRYQMARAAGLNGVIATVRHEYTNYEQVLLRLKGRVGREEAYERVREQLDKTIVGWLQAKYPGSISDPELPPPRGVP